MTTRAPSAVNNSAAHWPIPLAPPVMSATFPSKRPTFPPLFGATRRGRSGPSLAAPRDTRSATLGSLHSGDVLGAERGGGARVEAVPVGEVVHAYRDGLALRDGQ